MLLTLLLASQLLSLTSALFDNTAVHLPVFRRGGRFARHENVNLTALLSLLHEVELKYGQTEREFAGNRLQRRWKADADDAALFTGIGTIGGWYVRSLEALLLPV